MIPRFLPSALVLLFFILLAGTADAARLSNAQLRRYGFAGIYRGDAGGFVRTYDEEDEFFRERRVSQTIRETLPSRRQSVVTGPSGRNGFYLKVRRVTGNRRRITVNLYYSGISYNPVYEKDMVGSGTKILKVVKYASAGRNQYEMSMTDRLLERSRNGGFLYSQWNVRGVLFK